VFITLPTHLKIQRLYTKIAYKQNQLEKTRKSEYTD